MFPEKIFPENIGNTPQLDFQFFNQKTVEETEEFTTFFSG